MSRVKEILRKVSLNAIIKTQRLLIINIMRILLAGGGTGGHIMPLAAVARRIKENIGESEELEFLFIGPKGKLEKELFKKENIPVKQITVGKLRRYPSSKNFVDIFFKIPFGIVQALGLVFWYMPDIVFSKGGFASFPTVLACFLCWIPIIIHESDAVPGLANKICGKMARIVAVSFPETKEYFPKKSIITGNPVRKFLFEGNKTEGVKIFNLIEARPTILVLGGSQGAEKINNVLVQALPELLERYQIIHQCGEANFEKIKRATDDILKPPLSEFYHLKRFLTDELKHAFAAADLVVSRAGAGTISEIMALKKPSILIPLRGAAADHQTKNASILAHFGAARMLSEENLAPHLFVSEIDYLMRDPSVLEDMAARAGKLSIKDATERLAHLTVDLARGKLFK